MRFLIQEFRPNDNPDQTRLYLRLEREGKLRGWAAPKGIPDQPGVKRLALPVGNYHLDQVKFEGQVTSRQFGPGRISILDQGEYLPFRWTEREIQVRLKGKKFKGLYSLKFVEFKEPGGKGWLLEKQPETVKPPAPPRPRAKPAKPSPRKAGSTSRRSSPVRAPGSHSPRRKKEPARPASKRSRPTPAQPPKPGPRPKKKEKTRSSPPKSPRPPARRPQKPRPLKKRRTTPRPRKRSVGYSTSSSVARMLFGFKK